MIYYDLHIHSCLSPCANNDMTLNNIANMAKIKGLDLISITDHNSLLNSLNMAKVCQKVGIDYIYGVELQTLEEVHVLAYFMSESDVINFQKYIEKNIMIVKNNPHYFGKQSVLNTDDEKIEEVDYLLLSSLKVGINELTKQIHFHHGKSVLAHVLRKKNSIISQLGFIPDDLSYDGIEVNSKLELKSLNQQKLITNKKAMIFINSDAHQLIDINESINSQEKKLLESFFGMVE